MAVKKVILYHGTSTAHLKNIISEGVKFGAWLAVKLHHVFKIAEKTARRDGGEPIILEISLIDAQPVIGRNCRTFRYCGGRYSIDAVISIHRDAIEGPAKLYCKQHARKVEGK